MVSHLENAGCHPSNHIDSQVDEEPPEKAHFLAPPPKVLRHAERRLVAFAALAEETIEIR
jgi:hypothetical protein